MKIGKFEILAELGQGAMGKVYRARDTAIGREVALKTVAPSLLQDPQAYDRFQREAQSAGRLQHANIVTIYELGKEADGTLYFAMELVEGVDLGQVMHPADRSPLERKVRMVVDICRGLDYAHKQGVVHRDVKPANVRISRDGVVKILDFGVARLADSDMTRTGLLLGTPSYMSPEVLKGARVDYRTDMWATGVILFEVLSGKRPFEADTIPGLVYKIVHEPLPSVDVRGAPEPVVAVARKALEKSPAARYEDMAEMARSLLDAIGATPPADPFLDPAIRARTYERNFEEARQRLADNDLTGALQAARRAQAFDPAKTAILALISTIEEQLRGVETFGRPVPRVAMPGPRDPTRPVRVLTSTPTSVPPSLGTATLTDLRTRGASVFRELATFGGPPATQAVSLSPVKDVLAVAGNDGAIRMWDLYSRAKVATLRTELHERTGRDALVLCLAFSPDGGLLASGHVDAAVHLWDVERGHEVPVKLRHEAVVGTLAFSPDGSTLATGSVDSCLRFWDVGAAYAGEARRELHRQPASVTAVAYAGGGDWLITGHSNKVLRLLDARTGRLLASIRGPEAPVSLVLPSPDGQHIAVASQDRSIRIFDLSSREQVTVVAGHRKAVTSLCFLAEGTHLASVAQENEVQLWDLEASRPIAALSGPASESFVGLALFGAGDHIAVALGDGRIRLWGPAS
jgi:WD40 repeat protein/tRNA A-37 threonylcarbamoyl transferase component Bud32